MITICLTYFRSLTLANLVAALHSVQRQDMSCVEGIVIIDNNTVDDTNAVQATVDRFAFPVPVHFLSLKHGNETKTHSWSTNIAVSWAFTPWVLFTRADYVLHFDLVRRFVDVAGVRPAEWRGFITSDFCHLAVPIEECERTSWRVAGTDAFKNLHGRREDYSVIDSGVWMTKRAVFDSVGGLDEDLSAWGHAQTHFQHKLHVAGVEFVRVPEVLFYHPHHGAPRDINVAHRQLGDKGFNIKDLWKRYEGQSPYGP